MTLSTDIANDYELIDGVQDVTVTPQNPSGTAKTGVKALRRAITKQTLTMFGGTAGISPTDTPFHLWVSTLDGYEPEQSDKITDAAGTEWTIVAVTLATLGTRYACLCRKM